MKTFIEVGPFSINCRASVDSAGTEPEPSMVAILFFLVRHRRTGGIFLQGLIGNFYTAQLTVLFDAAHALRGNRMPLARVAIRRPVALSATCSSESSRDDPARSGDGAASAGGSDG